jgi:hypothetical protein
MSVRPLLLGTLLIAGVPGLKAEAQATPVPTDQPGYERIVQPFLKRYCAECHAGAEPEGEFGTDVERLSFRFGEVATRRKWQEVVNVLNSHEMPPETAPQPTAAEVSGVVDWITSQAVQAELVLREQSVVMRRLNRAEYRNTIRDLVGIDYDPAAFPEDPPAGGFDNNGSALTLSPLHIELYLAAAQQILDRALAEGPRPAMVRWRFDPKTGDMDRTRVRLDERNNPIVNGGNNRDEGDWVVVHHNSWDKTVGARDFAVPTPGVYAIRVRAAGRRPTREQVVASAERALQHRRDEQDQKNPNGKRWTQEQFARDLEHFRTDRMYDYGPPRIKLIVQLGPQPTTLAEFDADGSPESPKTHEFTMRLTTERMGIGCEYAYAIPKVLENFWMQGHDNFARPELLIDWIEIEGPLYDAWPPASHTGILFLSPLAKSNEAKYAREVLAKFMRRAYRRPVEPAEVDAKLALFTAARKDAPFLEAIKLPLIGVLTSPHFLFLVEPQGATTNPAAARPAMLNDHQLAARLSYFLWSSPPDEPLAKLAEAGKLKDPQVRQAQVDRMLADPKAEAFVTNFAGQWLSLREVGNNPPAVDLYPQYDRHLETSMVAESEAYVREFLQQDLDVRGMIRSDFVTINERLARFYGIPDVRGDEFRRVTVPAGVERGGIVTQASILAVTSNGTRTSPVKRGTWILKTLLGTDPGLPVANAGEIAPKVPGIDKATVRKRLEIHRELPQCARCHSKIDPLGFALENYNAAGEWRLQEGFGYKGRVERDDPVIDASSRMPDGREIDGVRGLQEALLAQDGLFLSALASRVMTYALGRELGLADQPMVQAAVVEMRGQQGTLRSLLKFVVGHEAFASK